MLLQQFFKTLLTSLADAPKDADAKTYKALRGDYIQNILPFFIYSLKIFEKWNWKNL